MSTTDHGDDPSIISNGDHEQRPAPTQRNRLPALFEVLNRMTQSPVDLFSFYVYMRDQQRSVDYLDFWYVTKFFFSFDKLSKTVSLLAIEVRAISPLISLAFSTSYP